jgi:hypothetical protein
VNVSGGVVGVIVGEGVCVGVGVGVTVGVLVDVGIGVEVEVGVGVGANPGIDSHAIENANRTQRTVSTRTKILISPSRFLALENHFPLIKDGYYKSTPTADSIV